MSRIITDVDQFTGIKEEFHKDPVTGQVRIKRSQDVTDVTNLNQQAINNESGDWKGEMHHVARVPAIMVEIWREELKAKGFQDPNPLAKCNAKWLIAKLNSRDFAKFRTKSGTL